MTHFGAINSESNGLSALSRVRQNGTAPGVVRPAEAAGVARGTDGLELSEDARLLSRLRSENPTRPERIAEAKAKIEAGYYDGAGDPIERAIDALIDDLDLLA